MVKNEVTKATNSDVAEYNEEFTGTGMLGLEGLDIDDIAQPRLVINQALSPLVVEGTAPVGTIANNLNSQILGKEVMIQPIKYFKTRIKWVDRLDGGGIDCRSFDGANGSAYGKCLDCSYRAWGDTPPDCDEIHNFLCRVLGDTEMIAMVSFSKTSFKSGRMLLSKIAADASLFDRPIFAKKYKLVTKQVKNDKGVFYIFDTDAGVKVSEEDFAKGATLFKSFASISSETIASKVDYSDDITTEGENDNGVSF